MTPDISHDQTKGPKPASRQAIAHLRHELRTPINHIIGYCEMLLEDAQASEQTSRLADLESVHAAGRELLDLVSDSLDPARVEDGAIDLERLWNELVVPTNRILGCCQSLQEGSNRPPDEEFAQDVEKIGTAARRLLAYIADDHALSATSKDDPLPPPPHQGGANQELGNPRWDTAEGIWGDEGDDDLVPAESSGFILVVDDDAVTRDLMSRRLKRQGHEVAVAASGQEALDMLRQKIYGLVLLDVQMPDMNGYQVLEQIKSDDDLRYLPVIMLSAVSEMDSVAACIEMGADDYLLKPFNAALLTARIAAGLDKKRLRDQEVFYLQQIESANAELEKRVEERVQELMESNRQLQSEIAERKALENQLQASMEEMAVVDRVARIITSTLNVDDVYQKFAQEVKKLVDFDRASINVIDKETGTFEIKYVFGEAVPERYAGVTKPLGNTQTEYVMKTGQPLLRPDITTDLRFRSDQCYLEMGLCCNIIVPLISTSRVIGALSLRSQHTGTYGERERAILERLASQIASAIENAALYEQTRAEKERATNALAQLQALLDGVDAGILLLGQDNDTVLWANHRFGDFFGINNLDDLLGGEGHWSRLRHQMGDCFTEPEETLAQIDRVLQDQSYAGSEVVEAACPEPRTLQRFTTPVYSNQEEYIGRLWVYYDITEEKHLEAQFLQAQKMESVGRLAGGIAHDFNNLLTPIMGYADMGATLLPDGHPTRGNLEQIRNAAERAASLTRQLLAFSRRQAITSKTIRLDQLVSEVESMLRVLVGEDIELEVAAPPDLWPVKLDPGQFEQVLLNLAVNSRDALPEGGKIKIQLSNVSLEESNTYLQSKGVSGHHVALSFTDNGTGMSEEVKARIFEPFFTTKEEGKGTGLGLSTCYGIIQQSGGHMEVESGPGKGTTFTVYLPRCDESPDHDAESVESSRPSRGTETVLLTEDEPAVRHLITAILTRQGYNVLEAANGHEALKLSQEHPNGGIHLLLTDVVMPQMGGLELAKRLLANDPSIRVIFTSGYPDDALAGEEALGPSAEFLAKPFSPVALTSKVREVLDR